MLVILALLGTAINGALIERNSDVVASVGREKITVDAFLSEYRKSERYIQSMFNFGLSSSQLKEMGVGRMVLTNLIQEKVIAQLLKRMNLHIHDSIAIDKIKRNELFLDDNKFSRAKLENFLDRNDLTEREYIEKVKQEIAKEFLFTPFFHIQGDYGKLARLFYDLEYQIRKVDVIKVNKSELPSVAVPTEAELLSFYNENKGGFIGEEYRTAEYATISEQTVKKELISVTDSEVQKKFESLQLGKRYYVDYIEFESREDAERMKKSIAANPEFYANDIKHIDGAFKIDLPSFLPKSLQWDGNKWLIIKDMGKFYLYRVVKIVPVSAADKEKSIAELSKFMVLDKLGLLAGQIGEDLASGADWETLKEKYGIKLQRVGPIGKDSRDKEGNAINIDGNLLEEIFKKEKGIQHELVSPANELIIFSVTSVEPAAEQPFEKVRAAVIKAVSSRKQEQIAFRLLQEKLVSNNHREQTIDLYRPDVSKSKRLHYEYSDDFIAEIFNLSVGDTTKLFESEKYFFIGKVLEKRKPEPDEVVLASIEAKIREELGFSMLSELIQTAVNEFKVKVTNNLIKDLL
ncbi:peptidylprolyl isomerase [Neorickettsia helminthoeca]|uniref:peptidylprolyl isomerase n=1 Tax=Neorickettsia helminthoeca TaxID=33994 RepID=UPI001E57658E|nr:peptidylprolyl isomerase [Neorickettsia helminthoeca]